MTLDKIAQAYTDWVAYETNPSPQLKDQLARLNERPTAEADRFFADLVKKYSEATDVFWIQQAIAYAQSATDKAVAQQYLEQLLSDYSRYGVLGPVLKTACSRLGMIAKYPNQVLAQTIEAEHPISYPGEEIVIFGLRTAAYGGYIMTVAGFQPGFDAGQAMKASQRRPTLAQAEEVIAQWRAAHPESKPSKS